MGERLKDIGRTSSEGHVNGRTGVQVLPDQNLVGTPAGEASTAAREVVVVGDSVFSPDPAQAVDTVGYVQSIAERGVRLGKKGFRSSRVPSGNQKGERRQGRPGRSH